MRYHIFDLVCTLLFVILLLIHILIHILITIHGYIYLYIYVRMYKGLSTSLSQELVKRLEKSSATPKGAASEGATSETHYTPILGTATSEAATSEAHYTPILGTATSDPHYTTQYASILVTARKLQREMTLASLVELFLPYTSPFVGGDLAWIGGSIFGSVKVCTSIYSILY